MTEVYLLGRRAVREVIRYPEATIPTLFIPLFFLAVNIGQVSETFPDTTSFLNGQDYAAFQLPVSLIITSGEPSRSSSSSSPKQRPNRLPICLRQVLRVTSSSIFPPARSPGTSSSAASSNN